MDSVLTAATTKTTIDPLVAEVVRVMAKARRDWSRDDYGDETQDEYVAAEVIAFLTATP